MVPINVERFRRIFFPQVDRFKVVEVGLVQVDGVVLEDGVLTCLDHPFHLGQVGLVLLLLLPIPSRLLLVESVDVLWPAALNVSDSDVREARVVGEHILAGDVDTVLDLSVGGRQHLELFLVRCFGGRDVDGQLVAVLVPSIFILKEIKWRQKKN